jgi:mRNA interferase MazF
MITRGEIYLAKFPLAGTVGVKIRPTLALTGPIGSVPEYIMVYISSVIPNPLLPTDLLLDPASPECAGTNLKQPSVVRLHKLATLHQRDVIRRLGQLSPTVMSQVEAKLRVLLNL